MNAVKKMNIKLILKELASYKWEAMDNAHTVSIVLDNFVNKIEKEVEK